jgi:hypothetical protein
MAITTYDQLVTAYAQRLTIFKNTAVTTLSGLPFTVFTAAGFPVAGASNPANTTTGVVPVSGNTGYPTIEAPQGSNLLYLRSITAGVSLPLSITIYDVLFWAGAVVIPTTGSTVTSLTSRPSFAGRVPFMADGVTRDWSQVELWTHAALATGNQAHTIAIDYLDQGGAAGTTPAISTNSLTVNRMVRMPLAAGDTGVSDVTGFTIVGAASATGSLSVLALRRIRRFRVPLSAIYGPDYTGMPQIFPTSALMAVVVTDGTSSGAIDLDLEIAQG